MASKVGQAYAAPHSKASFMSQLATAADFMVNLHGGKSLSAFRGNQKHWPNSHDKTERAGLYLNSYYKIERARLYLNSQEWIPLLVSFPSSTHVNYWTSARKYFN